MLPKEMYKLMLKAYIKPIFKDKGYKTKGNIFVKESDNIIQIIHLIPGTWNTKDENSFTIDLKICSKEFLKAIGEELPNNWFSYNTIINPLIECALENLKSSWSYPGYTIREDTDIKNVAMEVKKDLEEIIFPYVEKLNSINEILNEIEHLGFRANFTHKITLYYLLNKKDMAQKEFLKCWMSETLNPNYKPRILKIANKLGLEIPTN
ncbi:DUF4304 domain-containing protein [Bacillus sp. RG28]|uniref:DUF4304 domain-containing protein n=1 Tax=Gottfriedia endophytica TaxID=2820819 RepID=A0A940NSH9_9BACI|nr:DUF4304 domain-containing protein [Gottfriedia endophytica]MBP0724078.1 DUF4304 domain-containing protein [Gottfriedia endophytica]